LATHSAQLLCTPYCNDGWEMAVRMVGRLLLLDVRETGAELARLEQQSDHQRKLAYTGYLFEQLCSEGADDLTRPADPCEAFCSVVAVSVGEHGLVLCTEVDCAEPETAADHLDGRDGAARDGGVSQRPSDLAPAPAEPPDHAPPSSRARVYLELKTARRPDSERTRFSFERHKLLKWWAQPFPVGVPAVLCGWRDDQLRLHSVERLDTLAIPRTVRGRENMWDASACLLFAQGVLGWLRARLSAEPDGSSFVLAYDGRGRCLTLAPCCEPLGAQQLDPVRLASVLGHVQV
jgi:RAT1-interacting protein